MKCTEMLESFYSDLIDGRAEDIRAGFPSVPALDTPFFGAVDGDEALIRYVKKEGAWLRSLAAKPTAIATTASPDRVACELELAISVRGEATNLPVVLIGQTAPGGFGQVRIYHSLWPIELRHKKRPPIVWPAGALAEPPAIRAYFHALATGHKAAILATLADDAYVREPSGGSFRHVGRKALEEFYSSVFSQPGGVPLTHATATYAQGRFAVEYICHRWGNTTFPPVAGCALYDLSADDSLIRGIRIYDDVSPPG